MTFPNLRERISRAHDKLYRQLNTLLLLAKPCHIRKDRNGRVTCAGSRCKVVGFAKPATLCCGVCKYHDPARGCTVQSLGCKAFLCGVAHDNMSREHPDLLRRYWSVFSKAYRVNIGGCYWNKTKEINFYLRRHKQRVEMKGEKVTA